MSISRPGDLDLIHLTLKLVHIISRGMDNLRSGCFVLESRLISQHQSCQTRHVYSPTEDALNQLITDFITIHILFLYPFSFSSTS